MTDGRTNYMRRRDDRLHTVLIALLVGTLAALLVLWNRLSDVNDRLDIVEATAQDLRVDLTDFSDATTPATDSLLCALAFASLPPESLQGLDPEQAFQIACPVADSEIQQVVERIEEALTTSTTTP